MYVSKKTIEALALRGVIIRPTLYDFDEYLRRQWEWSYNYCSTGTPENERREQANKWIADKDHRARRWWEENKTLYIIEGATIYEMKNRPSYQETTLQEIEKRIERERKKYNNVYGEFCRKMQKILQDDQLNTGFTIYPTTYGVGVLVVYNWRASECVKLVENAMKSRAIEYYNEYSDKKWVYRFKVSKNAENLRKIG